MLENDKNKTVVSLDTNVLFHFLDKCVECGRIRKGCDYEYFGIVSPTVLDEYSAASDISSKRCEIPLSQYRELLDYVLSSFIYTFDEMEVNVDYRTLNSIKDALKKEAGHKYQHEADIQILGENVIALKTLKSKNNNVQFYLVTHDNGFKNLRGIAKKRGIDIVDPTELVEKSYY